MTRRRRFILICLVALPLLALSGWRVKRWVGRYWPPENTGDYDGPLTRAVTPYDPAKPPSRPWVDPRRIAPAPTTHHTYTASAIHGQETDYLLYLPPGYDDRANASRRYPVIYWLHGFGSEPQHGMPFIDGLDAAIRTGRTPPVIAVLPNGLFHSWYVDSVDGSQPVESVIIQDLIPHMDRTHRTIARREARATEGFSMGGWGAAHLAFKYPDLFCSATMLCAPLHSHKTFPQLYSIFSMDKAAFYAEDPITRIRRHPELRDRVKLRLFVGANDWSAGSGRAFHKRLEEWQIPHDFAVVPNAGHDTADIYQGLGPEMFDHYQKLFGGL